MCHLDLARLEDTRRAALLPKHGPQIADNGLGGLPGGKVAAARVRLLVDDVAKLAGPDGGDDEDLAREAGEADLDALLVLGHGRPQVAAVLAHRGARLVLVLVVEPHARRRAGRAEPVDAEPGADLVVGPGVRIGPVVQLLV